LRKTVFFFKGYCSEPELIEQLRGSPFAVIPTGDSDNQAGRPELWRLSLPSRIPFIVATAHTPLIVLGRQDGAASQFVRDFALGLTCDYEAQGFLKAVETLQNETRQICIRRACLQLAPSLEADGLAKWIWDSLEKGHPADNRFDLFGNKRLSGSVVITPNEINQRHGSGALIRRMFPCDNTIISIRSYNHYGGEHQFGVVSIQLDHQGKSRVDVFQSALKNLTRYLAQRVFCVPFFQDELFTAIAVKEISGAPMATYIMDDQNICVNHIPDELMKEFLSKCSVRFATHPEMRDAYENKYGLKFWLLPAVVPDRLITMTIATPNPTYCRQKRGALLGSIWNRQWFLSLCKSVQGAGIQLDWFGNSQYHWLTESDAELRQMGVNCQGIYPEDKLADKLRQYPFVVVPASALDEKDEQPHLQLSLPGRIIFNLAVSNAPIILFGSPRTSAANFINRFKIGIVCDYTAESFKAAVDDVLKPENQKALRENAVKIAKQFSDKDIDEWIWRSLEKGEAADSRFESLLPRSHLDFVRFIEAPVPPHIYRDFAPVYQVMRRLKGQRYQPDFVVDVGASHGIWSHAASQIFPNARFILIDPLISQYAQAARNYYIGNIPKAELLEIALSNQSGKLRFQVSPDLYGSSLLTPADFRDYDTIEVEAKTLDQVASKLQINGRGILKLDVQCAEHLILEGAAKFLQQLDIVIAELSFIRYDNVALIFNEMINILERLGFRYYDETGEWRSPIDGTLLQKEVVFIRQNLLVPPTSRQIDGLLNN
jgi:FkbM family methyltransferase